MHARSGINMRTSPEVGECDLFRGDRCPVYGALSTAEIGLRPSHDDVGVKSTLLIRTAPLLCVGFEGHSDE